MCFSAEASFGAAVVITTIGVIAVQKAETKPLRLLALIPILFGAQQFFEGFVWLSFGQVELSGLLKFSTYGFILFAWMIWPIYIPFTLWKLEKQNTRKRILFTFILIGLFVIGTLTFVLTKYGMHADIQDCNIDYKLGFESGHSWILGLLYLSTTTLSHFISSLKYVWILGVINLITYLITKMYFDDHLISVWCFFAALSSLVILWIVISETGSTNKNVVRF